MLVNIASLDYKGFLFALIIQLLMKLQNKNFIAFRLLGAFEIFPVIANK
jgi:hypothetical protein